MLTIIEVPIADAETMAQTLRAAVARIEADGSEALVQSSCVGYERLYVMLEVLPPSSGEDDEVH